MDKEQVISGLKTIIADDKMWRKMDYYATICKEALKLIEQEPTKIMTAWVATGQHKELMGEMFMCVYCKKEMFGVWEYCPHCGKKMYQK